MTDYASNYTPRVRIEYTVDSVAHKATLRLPRGSAPTGATVPDIVEAWRSAMAGVYGLTGLQSPTRFCQADITAISWADEDADLFLPAVPTTTEIVAGDDTDGGATPQSRATLLSITGLTTQGGKITLYLWGARIDAGGGATYQDWRFGPSELTGIPALWLSDFDPDSTGSFASFVGGADGNPVAFFRQRLNVRLSASAINAARQ